MTGKIKTEGDKALKANIARQLFNVDGTGVKVGIISTSFNSDKELDKDINSGDLPGKNNPNERTTSVQIIKDLAEDSQFADDEGRALAQIIHDVAPGAELYFHTFIGGDGINPVDTDDSSYATAVNSLVDAGVDIIVDDAQFPTNIFQDGKAAQTVQKAVDEGVVYVSASGNNGNIAYESEFRSGETFSLGDFTFEAHDFDSGDAVDLFQDIRVSKDETILQPLLSWDEPIDNASSAYEMFLLSTPELPNENNILNVSVVPTEEALGDPLRQFAYSAKEDEKLYLLVAKVADSNEPSNRIKWISTANGSDRTTDYEYIDESKINHTVFGPANAEGVITVGASDIENPLEPRTYSSSGSAPILFDTEGKRLAKPIIRNKPQLFAPDGVTTTFDRETSFNPFNGTSAAAPHAAGVIALMLERAGGKTTLSPDAVNTILQQTATPITSTQIDAGLIRADKAIVDSFTTKYASEKERNFVRGTTEAENFYGNEGNDIFKGDGGSDYLVGEGGNDILLGGDSNDVLVGGAGYNLLVGGADKDTFVLENDGFALISDFDIDRDRLAIAGVADRSNITFSATNYNFIAVENDGNTIGSIFDVEASDRIDIVYI